MKVFEIVELGETTHIAFDGSEHEALEGYIEDTMCDENEIDSIEEIPQKEWKNIIVKFDEYGIEPFEVSVEELIKGQKSNEVLCSTAYL